MKVSEFCIALNEKLKKTAESQTLALSALALKQAFKVADDEVAFIKLDASTEMLHFVWPLKMVDSGMIPLKNRDSLVARTVRENRSELYNHFSVERHASFFELVNLASADGAKSKDKNSRRSKSIQKIMSVPLLCGERIIGAVQVSRKADDVSLAGPDFTDAELDALAKIAAVVGSYI